MPQILRILIFTSGLTLTSCSNIMLGIYGINEVRAIDEATILKFAKEFNIPENDIYELDTAYISYLKSQDTSKYKSQINNHKQPLQVLYYDNAGKLKSFHINCNASGFPNLTWNRDRIFETFLPKQQTPIDSIVPLATQLQYLIPLHKAGKLAPGSYDYVVLVYWNQFMGRQSKRLIQVVQDNIKLAGDNKVKILYVNNDNLFAYGEKAQSN